MSTTIYTAETAGKYLDFCAVTVKRHARAGKLRGSKPNGRDWRFTQEELDDFLAAGRTAQAPMRKPARNPRYANR